MIKPSLPLWIFILPPVIIPFKVTEQRRSWIQAVSANFLLRIFSAMEHQGEGCLRSDSVYMESSTPLHLASQEGDLQSVRLLLDRGADINAVNSRQQTPLYLSAVMGYPECVMAMLQHSADSSDVSTSTHSHAMALIECFRHGEKMRECITELVHRGADVSCCNRSGVSAVHQAVNNSWDLDMIKLLLVEGRGMDSDRTEGVSPFQILLDRKVWHYRDVVGADPPDYADLEEDTTILLLRMGATRTELKKLLWHELNFPIPSGVLLETLMDSFSRLPSLSELDADLALRPKFMQEDPGDTLWEIVDEEMSEEARMQEEERVKAIVAEKKRYYHQRSKEVPILLHLCRAATRSNFQADIRKVISWPVPQCVKRYILLDHVQ